MTNQRLDRSTELIIQNPTPLTEIIKKSSKHLIRCITGHVYTFAYAQKYFNHPPTRRDCGQEQTLLHFIENCNKYTQQRRESGTSSFNYTDFINTK